MHLPFILNRRFRTGTVFHLKEWQQLGHHERRLLTELSGDENVYGLFIPTQPADHLTAKLAYTDTALLYFHFQSGAHLPQAFANRPEENVNKNLFHLVLDRVLEMEENGEFVSGSQAMATLYGPMPYADAARPSVLSSLSMQAISHAFLLPPREVKVLAQWLYTCNTWPLDAASIRELTHLPSLYAYLFPEADEKTHWLLKHSWHFLPPSSSPSWYSWQRPGTRRRNNQPTYKLYISPVPADLPEVLSASLPVLTESDAFCFKTGATVQGLLRPDKLLAYFTRREALFETAAVLEERLAAYQVQGVPFTCALDRRGMLSWGTDPPADDLLQSVEDGSWRTWVTEQLALAIVQAKSESLSFREAAPFLQAKMRVAGIHLTDWKAVEEEA